MKMQLDIPTEFIIISTSLSDSRFLSFSLAAPYLDGSHLTIIIIIYYKYNRIYIRIINDLTHILLYEYLLHKTWLLKLHLDKPIL